MLLTSLFALTAFILNWFAACGCTFVTLALAYGNPSDPSSLDLHFGIWFYQAWTVVSSLGGSVVFKGCWGYPDYVELDGYMKSARAFSTMALIVGAGFMFADAIASCTAANTGGRRAASASSQGVGYMVACLFCGLSLLLLQSEVCTDNDLSEQFKAIFPNMSFDTAACGIATGAKCAISATVFYFLASVSSLYAYKLEQAVTPIRSEGLDEPLVQE